MKKTMKVSPSIIAGDFANLAAEVKKVEKDADYLHLDVMDGHFVPNLTFGIGLARALRKVTDLRFDSHLMVETPEDFVDEFCEISDIVSVHYETTRHLHRLIHRIKEKDVKAFVAINPHTPTELLSEVIMDVDGVLIMSVNPGFSWQTFIPNSVNKVRKLDELRKKTGLTFEIEIDGGINIDTVESVINAGADMLVSGGYVFGSEDPSGAIKALKGF